MSEEQKLPDVLLKRYSETEIDIIIQYLSDKETDEWQALLKDDNSLTVENIKKVFDNGWQWWNTYSEDKYVELVDRNERCDNVDFGLVDWDKVIKLAKTDDDFRYNLHQYADYATIFIDFTKDGIMINCPFVNECALEHLCEDIDDGKCTFDDLDNILKGDVSKAVAELKKQYTDEINKCRKWVRNTRVYEGGYADELKEYQQKLADLKKFANKLRQGSREER